MLMKNLWLKQILIICTQNKYRFFLVLLFAFFAVIYSYGLFWLPPEYDEVLVSNAALNCPSNTFIEQVIWIKGQCVPIMLSSYIGGFMAVPYKLFFAAFGNSLLTFRVVTVLLTCASLVIVYLTTKEFLSKKVGLLTALLVAFDFQFFYNVRLERTMVVPFLFKSIFLFFTAKYLQQKKNQYLWLTGLSMGLSIWTKFDAVFFYTALILGWIISHHKEIKVSKKNVKNVVLLGSGFLVGCVPLLYYLRYSLTRFLFIGKEVAGQSFLSVLGSKTDSLFFQFFSYDAVNYITRVGVSYTGIELVLALISFVALIISIIFAYKQKKLRSLIFAVLIFCGFYLLYGGLKFSHHRTLIYPLPQALLAYLVVHAKHRMKYVFLGVFLAIFVVSLSHFYTSIETEMVDVSFSGQIFELQRYVSTLDGEVLIGDWGITNQLILLSESSNNLVEVAFAANTDSLSEFSSELNTKLQSCKYLVLRKPTLAIFKNADHNLRTAVDGKLVYTDQVFEVYSCESK